MKVLLDTNIVIDYALERQPFWQNSEQIFLFLQQGRFVGYISASTVSDLYYIIRKQRGHSWTLNFLERLVKFCPVATVDRAVITAAFAANFKDFEDAIQYSTAVTSHMDAIATRNPSDFTSASGLQILTPDQLIQSITP
jgi:predicted nucleic acid-binding protein